MGDNNLELPLKKRTRLYRFFEMLPAILSYGMVLLLVILSIVSPIAAAVYLLLVIVTVFIRAVGIAIHTIAGRRRLDQAVRVDWHGRLLALERPAQAYKNIKNLQSREFGFKMHCDNLHLVADDPDAYPKPSEVYNAVIVAAYNETQEVLEPTLQAVASTSYDNDRLIVVLAYEERGGRQMQETAERLQKKFGKRFYAMHLVRHPKNLPDEVVGKGANITYAGHFLQQWLNQQGIAYENVIVTTLDSDNRPHPAYFDYLTYEYIVHPDRLHLSYQPLALFTNNIWDVPAPMRVVATGNSFWNIISSMRPHTLRNFASHSQPMAALVGMNFWSKRTIVEDGHQYWRSYFYYRGDYSVTPIYVPIYQDAVLSYTYWKTLKAQFIQLRRWAYGASDVPYVATRIFTKNRQVPFWPALTRLIRLIDGHVTLASMAVMVAFGGWIPMLVNREASRNIVAMQLPEIISLVQQVAMVGLFVTVFMSFKILPSRPPRYKRRRSLGMLLQWFLMPITSLVYSSASAYTSQTLLLLGKYLTKFDVTDKATAVLATEAKTEEAGRDGEQS